MTLDPDAVRGVVREVLLELIDAPPARLASALAQPEPTSQAAIPVTLADDADLQSFVQQVLRMAEDPVRGELLRGGRITFRLAGGAGRSDPSEDSRRRAMPPDGSPVRIAHGALTEKVVAEAARNGRSIVLAKGTVATPLALEKAKSLGVAVHKEAT
jgi:hypothetical protein